MISKYATHKDDKDILFHLQRNKDAPFDENRESKNAAMELII